MHLAAVLSRWKNGFWSKAVYKFPRSFSGDGKDQFSDLWQENLKLNFVEDVTSLLRLFFFIEDSKAQYLVKRDVCAARGRKEIKKKRTREIEGTRESETWSFISYTRTRDKHSTFMITRRSPLYSPANGACHLPRSLTWDTCNSLAISGASLKLLHRLFTTGCSKSCVHATQQGEYDVILLEKLLRKIFSHFGTSYWLIDLRIILSSWIIQHNCTVKYLETRWLYWVPDTSCKALFAKLRRFPWSYDIVCNKTMFSVIRECFKTRLRLGQISGDWVGKFNFDPVAWNRLSIPWHCESIALPQRLIVMRCGLHWSPWLKRGTSLATNDCKYQLIHTIDPLKWLVHSRENAIVMDFKSGQFPSIP